MRRLKFGRHPHVLKALNTPAQRIPGSAGDRSFADHLLASLGEGVAGLNISAKCHTLLPRWSNRMQPPVAFRWQRFATKCPYTYECICIHLYICMCTCTHQIRTYSIHIHIYMCMYILYMYIYSLICRKRKRYICLHVHVHVQ